MSSNIEALKRSIVYHCGELLKAQSSARASGHVAVHIMTNTLSQTVMAETAIKYQEMSRHYSALARKHLDNLLAAQWTLRRLGVDFIPNVKLGVMQRLEEKEHLERKWNKEK